MQSYLLKKSAGGHSCHTFQAALITKSVFKEGDTQLPINQKTGQFFFLNYFIGLKEKKKSKLMGN